MKNQTTYQPKRINHPGSVLAEKLQELNIGSKEFALRTGKPEKTISALLNEKSNITADMAILFEIAVGIPSNYWLKHQMAFDIYVAEQKIADKHSKDVTWLNNFPIRELTKLGHVITHEATTSQLTELLRFFGFSDINAWENYYFKQKLKVNFSISLLEYQNPYILATWLRIGELQASNSNTTVYNVKKFKTLLQYISKHRLQISYTQLQEHCIKSGVKVVYTAPINNLAVKGSMRWINNSPLIQIAVDFNSAEFWPTFFHEAAHILLHGKKEIFLEQLNNTSHKSAKEKEAMDLAQEYLRLFTPLPHP